MSRIPYFTIIGLGIAGVGLLLPLAFGGFEKLLDTMVSRQLRIIKGTSLWQAWVKVPVPILMRVFVFNITNSAEFQNGAKPVLKELGPYVYRETLEKVNISVGETGDEVKYKQVHHYYFLPELSTGTEEDLITFINFPLISIAKVANNINASELILGTLDDFLRKKGETLTKVASVKEYLWEGVSVQGILDVTNDPVFEVSGQRLEWPQILTDGKLRILEGKNETDDGWYIVKSGRKKYEELNQVVSWNETSVMKGWNPDESSCSLIPIFGTEGMFYQPFVKESTVLSLYVPQMCRTLSFVQDSVLELESLTIYRFKLSAKVFAAASRNPNNACHCSDQNSRFCNVDGIMPIDCSPLPLYLSHGHFSSGENMLIDSVIGLKPDPEKHESFIDIHPRTGLSLTTRHRFQFNVELKPWYKMKTFRNVQHMLLPMIWIEEGGDIDAGNKGILQVLDLLGYIWSLARWFGIGFFGTMTLIGGLIMLLAKKQSRVELIDLKITEKLFY